MAMKKITPNLIKKVKDEVEYKGREIGKLQAAKVVLGSVNRLYKSGIINREEARSILKESGLLDSVK